MKIIISIIVSFFFTLCVDAQNTSLHGWHLMDKATSGYYGISLDKAYQFLHEKKLKSASVIVAILDDGIDTSHEELRKVLWVNPKEIPGNGIDDDGNGYIDDVHGWNFLGNPDGRNVASNSSEWIRVYWRYKSKYEGVDPLHQPLVVLLKIAMHLCRYGTKKYNPGTVDAISYRSMQSKWPDCKSLLPGASDKIF